MREQINLDQRFLTVFLHFFAQDRAACGPAF